MPYCFHAVPSKMASFVSEAIARTHASHYLETMPSELQSHKLKRQLKSKNVAKELSSCSFVDKSSPLHTSLGRRYTAEHNNKRYVQKSNLITHSERLLLYQYAVSRFVGFV
jgi:hypothetical protein